MIYNNLYSESAMISFMLPLDIADAMAVSGGEDRNKLHITLLYIPSWRSLPKEVKTATFSAIKYTCNASKSLVGNIGGIGIFHGDKKDVFYLSVDIPGLEKLREDLVNNLDFLPFSKEHGFTPHITLKYIEKEENPPFLRLREKVPVNLTSVTMVTNGVFQFSYPLLG